MYYSHTQARSKLPKKRRRVLPVETVRQQSRTHQMHSNNGDVKLSGSAGSNSGARNKLGVITSIVQTSNNHHEEHMMTKRNPTAKSIGVTGSNTKLVESTNSDNNNHNINKLGKY
jgi:hypothetical protein